MGAPYHLCFWGSIESDGYASQKLGTEDRDFWFETAEERDQFQQRVNDLAVAADRMVVFNTSEGPLCTKRTVAVMVLIVDGKDYDLEYDFGFGYSADSAYWMFHEGNYGCDCNRSLFLHRRYPEVKEREECGEEIVMKSFKVEHREKEEG